MSDDHPVDAISVQITRAECNVLINHLAAPEAELDLDQIVHAGRVMAAAKDARGVEPTFHPPETDQQIVYLRAQELHGQVRAEWLREDAAAFDVSQKERTVVAETVRKLYKNKDFKKKHGASVELAHLLAAFEVV